MFRQDVVLSCIVKKWKLKLGGSWALLSLLVKVKMRLKFNMKAVVLLRAHESLSKQVNAAGMERSKVVVAGEGTEEQYAKK